MTWYVLLVAAVAAERLAELVVARRNLAWSRAQGGVEFGASHYPLMVVLHTGFLAGALAEVIGLHRPFLPALGWPMLAIVVGAQALRWWCITTLGRQWNTRVVVIPGAARVDGGPYRFFSHPPQLCRRRRRGHRPAVGAHRGSPHWSSPCSTRRCCARASAPKKRRAGKPVVIDLLVAGGGRPVWSPHCMPPGPG